MFHVQVNPPVLSAFGNSCTDLCMACSGNWLSGVREGVRGIRQKPYRKNTRVSCPSHSPPDRLPSPALHIPSGVPPRAGAAGAVNVLLAQLWRILGVPPPASSPVHSRSDGRTHYLTGSSPRPPVG